MKPLTAATNENGERFITGDVSWEGQHGDVVAPEVIHKALEVWQKFGAPVTLARYTTQRSPDYIVGRGQIVEPSEQTGYPDIAVKVGFGTGADIAFEQALHKRVAFGFGAIIKQRDADNPKIIKAMDLLYVTIDAIENLEAVVDPH